MDFSFLRIVPGVVCDNCDPEKLGRMKVQLDSIFPGCVSQWLPFIKQWSGNQSGFWCVPDCGTQVLAAFTSSDFSKGFVIGCVYDKVHAPPEFNEASDKMFQTSTHRIAFSETEGGEEIVLECTGKSDGKKIKIQLGKKGLSLVNESGDIKIKCRSLQLNCKNKMAFSADEKTTVQASGKFSVESGKNVEVSTQKKNILKAGKIKFSAASVCAENKQVACKNSPVYGMDTHLMLVQAGTGTVTVPMPVPFTGKIKSGVSSHVFLEDNGVAVENSGASHSNGGHVQLPGTLGFAKKPSCDGKITGGTVSSVKADGKKIAVCGSSVTTCNDAGLRNNSKVVCPGFSFSFPAIYNSASKDNAEENRKCFTEAKWSACSVNWNGCVELSASVKNIPDGNAVTFKIFSEACDCQTGVPVKVISAKTTNGSASVMWNCGETSFDVSRENPRFVFTVHCAWCETKKSSALEVKLERPEISDASWKDQNEKNISACQSEKTVRMCANVKNINGSVTFTVFNSSGCAVASFVKKCSQGSVYADWTFNADGEDFSECPEFYFEVSGLNCRNIKSGLLKIQDSVKVQLVNVDETGVAGMKCTLFRNGEQYCEKNLSHGVFEKQNLVPGAYEILFEYEDSGEKTGGKISLPEDYNAMVLHRRDLDYRKIPLVLNRVNRIYLQENIHGVSE